jgi:hypothetical protein
MKVLSLTQPWATLVVIGAKKFETRSWKTDYRGELWIHASKGFPRWAQDLCGTKVFTIALSREKLPCGMIIGKVFLEGCQHTEMVAKHLSEQEMAFGDYTPGRWAWQLAGAEQFAEPIPAKGSLGLWEF